ncbi:hypothetical protein psal_cds_140 [Pandoravirus salinus]|uniref:Uncharacterized protein n=1 Tax=Pandoravirus salinus TaxID=1349410 RepID=A0A291ATD8_9VIRU|nr:hypothetical protein psal_cds_140 [Pandoravirus salinus]ATE82123.1 hypothetical protein psal_cds_140 [Pandoravirus salinus]
MTHVGAADMRARREPHGVRVAQTAFVDAVMSRGDACGRLYDPARPYRTVKGAIDAIRGLSPLATAVAADLAAPSLAVVPWTVRAAPGVYAEDIVLPPGIGLVGAGRACTIVVGSVVAEGSGRLEALSVRSPSLPAVAVVLTGTHDESVLASVSIEALAGVRARGSRAVVDIGPASAQSQGRAVISDVAIVADLTGIGPGHSAVVLARGVRTVIERVAIQTTLSPSVGLAAIAADVGAHIDLLGGSVNVAVGPSAPQETIAILSADTDAAVYQTGDTTAYVLEAILSDGASASPPPSHCCRPSTVVGARAIPPKIMADNDDDATSPVNEAARGDVVFACAGPGSTVHSSGAVIDFATVPLGSRVLATAEAIGSSATVAGARMRFGFVPPVRGNVTYVAFSEQGNVTASGGLYTSVRALDSDQAGARHYLADADGTVLLGGTAPPALLLEDPAAVDRQVLYRGKVIVVKNVSAAATAEIEGTTLFDAPGGVLVLAPGEAMTLQNDGALWYIIGRSP